MPSGFYILCSIFGSLILCNLIVQTLNDVYTTKKEDSEEKYWQITNKYLAAIEMESCIDYDTGQVWMLMPDFTLIGVLSAAALLAAFAAVGGVFAGLLCTVAVIIVIRCYEPRQPPNQQYQKYLYLYQMSLPPPPPSFFKIIQGKQWYKDWKNWILQPYFSLTIDPDSIYQQITSLRLERHFRANHLQSN